MKMAHGLRTHLLRLSVLFALILLSFAIYAKTLKVDELKESAGGTTNLTLTSSQTVFPLDTVFSSETATTVPYLDADKKLTSSAITPTELGYLTGLTQDITQEVASKVLTASQALQGNIDEKIPYTYLSAITQDIIPATDNAQKIGTSTQRLNYVYSANSQVDYYEGLQIDFYADWVTAPRGSIYGESDSLTIYTPSTRKILLDSASGPIELSTSSQVVLTTAVNISNVSDPVSSQDVATKNYVDSASQDLRTDLDLKQNAVSGTANEIDVTSDVIGLADDAIFPGLGAVTLPIGGDADRPGSPTNGMLRYSTQSSTFEGYAGGSWGPIAGGGADFSSVTQDIVPATTDTYNLGTSSATQWLGGYFDNIQVSSTQNPSTPCPVVTTAQKSAIVSPSDGSCVYDSDLGGQYNYNATLSQWIVAGAVVETENVGEWTAYSPVLVGFGTVTSAQYFYKRVGDSVHIKGAFVSGTASATEAQIPLPSGLTVKSSWAQNHVGKALWAGSSNDIDVLATGGDSFVNFAYENAAFTPQNGNAITTVSGIAFSFFAEIPVNEWSSTSKYAATEINDLSKVGEIIMLGSSQDIPTGYLYADGSAVSRSVYSDLFDKIGTTYGVGDGSTTFNLPDFRGYFPRGFDDGAGVDSGRVFGSTQQDEFQGHAHVIEGANGNISATGTTNIVRGASGSLVTSINNAKTLTTDGVNGTPRAGTETRPLNIAVKFAIRYQAYDIDRFIQVNDRENVFSADADASGMVSKENSDWIDGDAAITDTSLFTYTFVSGFFGQAPNCVVSVNSGDVGAALTAKVASTSTTSVTVRTGNTTSAASFNKQAYAHTITCQRQGSDYKEPKAFVGNLNPVGFVKTEGVVEPKIASAKISNTGVVSDEMSDWIDGSVAVTDTSLFTFTLNSGYFGDSVNCTVSTEDSGVNSITHSKIVSTSTSSIVIRTGYSQTSTNFTKLAYPFQIICHGY